jgi:glycosyltransferase involved in cell wall biosynthesis
VWLPNVSRANRWLSFAKGFSKIERIMAMVDSVSAGCQYLADYARRVNPNVVVVPVSIDMARYSPPKQHVQNDVLTVGWTGSVTTIDYLRDAVPALVRAARNVRLRVKVLGGRIEIPGVEVECIDWRPDIEVDVIRSFDLGLKPSPREEWAKGKCPMKDLQYMALRIPPVATRFGTMLESIEHGRTGFLCDTEDDWVSAITTLADASRREAMGAEAREVVKARYSSTVAAAGFLQALELARRTFQNRSKH